MITRVAIVGGTGRLGSLVRAVIDELDGFEVACVLSSRDDLGALAALGDAGLVVDVSTPAVSIEVVRVAIERGLNVLVGTSGWSAERIALVRPLVEAAGTGAVFIPNFSLGSVLATMLATAAAPYFAAVEIVETHRETKIDSPSGTAVRTAELIAAARAGHDLPPDAQPRQRARGEAIAGVPVHSLRRPGVVARQDVVFGGSGESLSIAHDTVDPQLAYAPGIRIALVGARDARGVIVGLDSYLDLPLRADSGA